MGVFQRWINSLQRRWVNANVGVWYHPKYRLPLTTIEHSAQLEPRRADFVAWYLFKQRLIAAEQFQRPERISYRDLGRVHSHAYLESLTNPDNLARIFGVERWDVVVDELISTVRLACGGTCAAAKRSLRTKKPNINLMGGFHHAGPESGGGLCPVNDIAVSIAQLRSEGFQGMISVLDLDAHPPDGTSACLRDDLLVWQGSISGTSWGELERVDEIQLPENSGDSVVLEALEHLLALMPKSDLVYVIAGGDVLLDDHMGTLGMTIEGAQKRDMKIMKALDGVPSVWLPGGGYHPASWKVLANTGALLSLEQMHYIPSYEDPMKSYFKSVASTLYLSDIEDENFLTEDDIAELMGASTIQPKHYMGFYTKEGVEYSLYKYGLLHHIRRLGYDHFEVEFKNTANGERLRLYSELRGEQEVLLEVILQKTRLSTEDFLYVHWLTLRHPRAHFSDKRPKLPGQEMPGLGLAKEAFELLIIMAKRLNLNGVMYRPSWYHVAYAARQRYRFVDPIEQAHFEAIGRDLEDVQLSEISHAINEKRLLMNGEVFIWKAGQSAHWFTEPPDDRVLIDEEMEKVTFTLLPPQDDQAKTD
ncbi:MAG: histone deacetylase [Deltaproteobacteria bacterium]|nr:histone deacetylase [Deltaproteobacteria bacterium]MBU50294.1 histone deacetylase [Deltaproteobacteria bacterium]|tara:strand:- start:109 stop:1875 length:1767 start_codon:yes stop_codon:yes gene_type:complete